MNLKTTTALALLTSTTTLASVKTATVTTNIKPHASLRMSHYATVSEKTDGKLQTTPKLHLRPKLGATVAGTTVDLVAYLDKKTETTQVSQTIAPEVQVFLAATVLGSLSIEPFLIHSLPHAGAGASTLVASYQSMTTKLSTGIGTLSATLGLELGTTVTSREETTAYKSSALTTESLSALGYKANSDGAVMGKKKDQDFYHSPLVNLGLKVNAVKGLSLAFLTQLTNAYSTAYTINADGSQSEAVKLSQSTMERLRATYKLGEKLSLRNDLSVYQGGVFEAGNSGKVLRNELQLLYTL